MKKEHRSGPPTVIDGGPNEEVRSANIACDIGADVVSGPALAVRFAYSTRNAPVVEMVPVGTLKAYKNHPFEHERQQRATLVKSLRRFGAVRPILIDDDDVIVCGHGIVGAAHEAGFDALPAIRVRHLSEDEIRAYRLADNKLAKLAKTDPARLAVEFEHLLSVDFDLDLTGYSPPEIDSTIILGHEQDEPSNNESLDDELADIISDGPPVSRRGDLWLLGKRHRLLCGDARDGAAYSTLMADARAQMVFTDPPYNVPIQGNVSGQGAIRHGEFVMGSGELSRKEYADFLGEVFTQMVEVSRDGAMHFVCIDWRHVGDVQTVGEQVYTKLMNICVWVKTNAGMGSLYRSQHEMVVVFKVGSSAHINNVELGRHGRNRSNVWTYAGANAFGAERDAALSMHPTVKPTAMVTDAMLDCSTRGGIVLDPFAGSGTVFVAGERTGRVSYGMELDPHYVDTAIRRWEALTGEVARHAETGLGLDAVGEMRAGEKRVGEALEGSAAHDIAPNSMAHNKAADPTTLAASSSVSDSLGDGR